MLYCEVAVLLLRGEGKKEKSCRKMKRALGLWFLKLNFPVTKFSWVFMDLFMCLELNTW